MPDTKLVWIKNAKSQMSLTETVRLGQLRIAVEGPTAGKYTARLMAGGVPFTGTGRSVVLAIHDLTATITEAAVKQTHYGRTPDKVRIAATLLQGQ
jgi:hypothetical protein